MDLILVAVITMVLVFASPFIWWRVSESTTITSLTVGGMVVCLVFPPFLVIVALWSVLGLVLIHEDWHSRRGRV